MPRLKGVGHEADHVCLVPRLRMSGFVPPPSHVPSWHAQEHFMVEEGHVEVQMESNCFRIWPSDRLYCVLCTVVWLHEIHTVP